MMSNAKLYDGGCLITPLLPVIQLYFIVTVRLYK